MKPGCLEHEFSWGAPSQIRNFSATNPPNWNLGAWLTVTIKIWETQYPQIRYPQIGHIFDFQLGVKPGSKNLGVQNAYLGRIFRPSGKILWYSMRKSKPKNKFLHWLESTPHSALIGAHISTDRVIPWNVFYSVTDSFICSCVCQSIYPCMCHLCIYCQSERVFTIR